MSNALTPEQQRAMVAAYTIPLPEPAFGFLVVSEETGQWIESRAGEAAFDADNLHAHAAAVTAAKDAEIAQLRADNTRLQNDVVMPLRERVRVLEDALRMALAELDELPVWSNTGHVCNIARAALGDKT